MVWIFFQTTRKWKHPQHPVHHFYTPYYHQAQIYSDPEYILGFKKWNWTPIWYILNKMCIWIIHAWKSWLHCIICTCGWHPIPSNYHSNWIYRRPHSFCLGHLQQLSEYIWTNPAERVYLSLPDIYLDWYKRKPPKHPLASINQKWLCTQAIKLTQGTKPAGKLWYDVLK